MPSSKTISIRNEGKRIHLRKGPGWKESYLKSLIIPLLEGYMPDQTQVIPGSRNARLWKTRGQDETLVVKFFNPRGLKDKLTLFRKSRSGRAMEGDLLLVERGFQSPPVIAQADITGRLMLSENFLISRWIEGSFNTYEYMRTLYRPPLSPGRLKQKRRDLHLAGKFIGKLHNNGLFHGDLRPGNILVRPTETGPDFYLIDNERTRYFSKGLPPHLREKNLVQINMIVMDQIKFTDRMRFFKAYLDENPGIAPERKALIRRIHLRTKQRLSEKIPGVWDSKDG